MHDTRYTQNHEPTLAAIMAEIKEEVKEFFQTRVEMFKSELQEIIANLKHAIPSAVIAITLLITAYFLLTCSVVGLIVVAFWNNPYRWFFAFLIVGVLWLVAGSIAAFLALRRLRMRGMLPKRTIEVLKADKVWLEQEART